MKKITTDEYLSRFKNKQEDYRPEECKILSCAVTIAVDAAIADAESKEQIGKVPFAVLPVLP